MCCVVIMWLYVFFLIQRRPPRSTRTDTLFPYTTLFRSATALLLSACSFAPQYKLPDVPTDAQYHASVDANADTGWTPATPQDRLSRGHWWTRYGDEQPDALAARVETGSPDLAAALAHSLGRASCRERVCQYV